MQTYTDLEKQKAELEEKLRKMDLECVTCPKCSSQFFEEVKGMKFQLNHNLIPGQQVPPKAGAVGFVLLRCLRCANLIEPRVMHNSRDLAADDYNEFLDTLEGKGDTREKEPEEKKEDDEVQGEEL